MSRFVLTAQLQLQAPNNIGQVVQQIQNQLQNVQVNVQVQGVQQANRQTRQLASNLDAASDSANRLGRVFAVSVRRFTALAVATRAVSLFTNTLSGAIQEAIDFERELIKVSQVTGRALTELRDLTDTISNLSTSLGVSSQSLLSVTTILAQAGLNANDTKIALDTLAKSALAPNFDSLSETTEGAIAILAQFKQGVGALEAQLGSIDAVAGAFAVEAGDLIDVVRRAGGVFKSSGGSLNELLALFTSVRATTRESAESIGTGLRTIFTRIQRPQTIEFLKQFGVELVDLEGKFVGPFEAVRRLSGALAGLGEGDLTFIRVAEELGGFRQIGKVLPLLQQFALAQEALNVAQEGGAGLAKNAISAQAALAVRITKVREEFLALVRSITETSSFQIMANTALNLASALIKIGEALKPVLPLLGALAAIKVARGLGSFLGGIGAGFGSARGFNQGGKVLAFAKGGLVPGSGNRDTVPAMLTPGEFVMKKSAVESMGVSNLKAMNRGGKASRKVDYEAGVGPSPFESVKSNRLGSEVYSLQKSSGLTPGEFEMAKRFADTNGYSLQEFKQYLAKRAQEKRNKSGIKTNTNDLLATLKGGEPSALSPENERLRVMLGGDPRRFAFGGKVGAIALNPLDGSGSATATVTVKDILNTLATNNQLPGGTTGNQNLLGKAGDFKDARFAKRQEAPNGLTFRQRTENLVSRLAFGNKNKKQKQITAIGASFPSTKTSETPVETFIKQSLTSAYNAIIPETAKQLQSLIGSKVSTGKPNPSIISSIGIEDAAGKIFEGAISSLGAPFDSNSTKGERDAFDFPRGIGSNLAQYGKFKALESIPTDAKKSLAGNLEDIAYRKTKNFLAGQVNQSSAFQNLKARAASAKDTQVNNPKGPRVKKYLGGIIQKFARGGIANAPLVDDIPNATGVIQPRPSLAIARLLQAGGGAVDIDRTIKRTIGDKAFGSAKTEPQREAALQTYFRDDVARLRDVKTAPLTQFGQELQSVIKSGKLDGRRVSIISKSKRVPGIAEYLSQLFGIPSANMVFTSGQSKQPAMEAIRTKGPRVDRVARFATGGVVPGSGNRDTVPAVLQQGDFVIRKSSVKKIGTDNLASMAGYATGGGVDKSVPALLTPGEFVFSREQARGIGYGKLNRMNKVGKYATGGVVGVQKFARGTGSSGARPALDSGLALTLLPATLQSMIPPIDETSSAMTKLANTVLSMTTTVGGVVFALQSFGVSLTKASVSKFFGSGEGGAGDLIGGFRKGGSRSIGSGFQQQFLFGQKESSPDFASARKARAADLIKQRQSSQLNQTFAERRAQRRADTASLNLNRGPKAQGLTGQVGRFLGQKAAGGGITGRLAGVAARGISSVGGAVGGIGGGAVGGFASAALAATGPLLAIAGVAAGIDAIVGSFRDLDGQLQDAIKAQDTAKAQTLAVSKANADAIPLIGNLVGGFADLIGQGDALAGFLTIFGGNTANSIKSTIAAQIATAKANESLKKASEESAKAIQELEKGTISASQGLQRVAALTADAQAARQANTSAIVAQSQDRAAEGTFTARNILTLGGVFGETNTQRNRRIAQEQEKLAEENIRLQKESLDAQQPLINATARSVFSRGGSVADAQNAIKAQGGITPDQLRQQAVDLRRQAFTALSSGDTQTAEALTKQAVSLSSQANVLDNSLINLGKEVQRSQAAFKAMNIGLQGVTAAANAGLLAVNNYASAQEAGNNGLTRTIAILEAGITSAAQGISNTDFGQALSDVGDRLLQLGATPDQVRKAQGNIQAVNAAQRQFPSVLSSLRKSLQARGLTGVGADLSPERQKQNIGKVLSEQLRLAGVSDIVRKQFDKQFDNIKLDDNAINKLLDGDISVLEGPLKEIGEAALSQLLPVLKAQAEAQDTLNKLTKTQIELQSKLVSAQRQRLDIELEAAEIIGKFGGPAVTPDTRRQNAIRQANVQSQGLAPNLRDGTAREFNVRNRAIQTRLQQIQDVRSRAAVQGPNSDAARQLENESGLNLAAEEQRLLELAKSDYETTKLLIKQKETELELIAQKNKLERDSIDSLLTGDIEKFFDQQAAVGATAAIASGDNRLANMFGGQALGAAAQDIRRQQDAGVQSLFGRQLGGAGGLTETAFATALSAAGVSDPNLARSAAGTTGEELKLKADIVNLAGTLNNFGNIQVQAAQSELDTANKQVKAANMQLQAAQMNVDQRQKGAASAPVVPLQSSAGGPVYASRGTLINFKPRGTDTVPAMLTPGEFVVRREAVNRGNNLELLKAINNGSTNVRASSEVPAFAKGGKVQYYQGGGNVQNSGSGSVNIGIDPSVLTNFSASLDNFNKQLSQNISNLQNTKFQIALSPTNINVNLTGTSFLASLTETIKKDLITFVGEEIRNYAVGNDGKLRRSGSTLGTVT